MAPSQADLLPEHAQQISDIKVDLVAYRARLASIDDRHALFQDAVRSLSQQIGEAPRPDEGVEGHGLARAIAVLNERIEPIVEDHTKAEVARKGAPTRLRANISTAVAVIALVFTILTFATKSTAPSSAAPPPHAIVDAASH
jgi:hypothetical protein